MHKKDKNSHSIIREMLQYIHLMENLPNRYLLPKRDFHLYNPMLKYPVPSLDLISWNKEVLLMVQKCNNCNTVFVVRFSSFDNIKPIIDYRLDHICITQQQNEISYLTVKEALIKSIISFIDKEKYSKIDLKCMKIPADIYTKLVDGKKPFFYNDKENGNIPSWMITDIMHEDLLI